MERRKKICLCKPGGGYFPLQAKILNEKNAIVTGAGSGIGRATVKVFAENGASVWACAREKREEFELFLSNLSQECNVRITPVYFDMSDTSQIKEAFMEIRKGKEKIDILVNNAGTTYDALLPMLSLEKSRKLFEINYFSHIYLTQLVSRQMMREKEGSIVNTGSYLGFDGNRGQTMYSATKAAVGAMTRSLAKELADYNIRVNAVAPGVVDTKMIHNMPEEELNKIKDHCFMHRSAHPEEIANMIMVLSSELSSYVTGQIIRVDGGM